MPLVHDPMWKRMREALSLVLAEGSVFIRKRILWVLVLVLAAAALAPLGPLALKLLIDDLQQRPGNTGWIAATAGLYVVSQWLARSLTEVRGLVYARAERRWLTALSDRFFGHILNLPLRFHLQRETGAINQTLQNGLQGFQLILHHLVFTILPVAVQLSVTAWILLRLGELTFLAIFACGVVCYAVAFSLFILRVTKAAEDASAANVVSSSLMTDCVLSFETVKLFVAESAMRARVRGALDVTEERWVRFYRAYAMSGLAVAGVFGLFMGTTICVSLLEVTSGRMSVGAFFLVNSYVLQLMQPVELLGYAVQGLSQGAAMLAKMLEVLKEPAESQDFDAQQGDTGASLKTTPAALEFRNVSISYATARPVLENVSFRVPPRGVLGVVGSSGGGKSTLVRLLVRLLEPDEGEILLDGKPIRTMTLEEVRRSISVVPQDPVLFNESLRFNIALGSPNATDHEIARAADRAHLTEFIARQPDGYDTRVGERGVRLSGGERQRIAIARAALRHPRLYVFDEATSSLDTATERSIVRNLRSLTNDCTAIVIAHRLSTVEHADEIIVLEAGAIVESGTHAALIELGGRYASLWRAQVNARKYAQGAL